jgi:serine/threonine-protein kinase
MQPDHGGKRLGQYEVHALLRVGATGEVYRGVHLGRGQAVAIKVLQTVLRADARAVECFLREAERAVSVSHPNLVYVSDVGLEDGVPYVVMELLHGETLQQRLARQGPMSLSESLDVLLPLVSAVEALQMAGVVHRDLQAANVLLARQADGSIRPKLLDFGRELGPATDPYALVSLLVEMLTGRSPQASADGRPMPLGGAPRALRVPASLLPAGFEKVLWRASAPALAARYGSLASLVAALLPYASHTARAGYTRRTEALRTPRSSSREPSLAHALAHGHASEAPGRGRALELGGLLAVAFALSVGIAVGAAQSGKDAPVRLQAAQEPAPLATIASPNAARMLHVTPAQAEASIDGRKLGSGAVSLGPFSDNTLHTLRVEAPGYVTRVVLFRGAPDVQHIGLVAAPTARLSRAPFAAQARR